VASCAATRCSSIAATGSITEAITSTIAGRLPWGEDHHRVYRRLLGHRLGMSTITEDLPEEHNRVTLDPVLKDSSGIPAPRIDYTIGDNTRKMLAHGIARSKDILAAAGHRIARAGRDHGARKGTEIAQFGGGKRGGRWAFCSQSSKSVARRCLIASAM